MDGKLQDNESNLPEVPKDAKPNSSTLGSPIKSAVERTYCNDRGPRNAINVSRSFATWDQKYSGAYDESYENS